MEAFFLKLVNMSITGSYFALAIMLYRIIFKKAPKWLSCLLWGFVALRLTVPFSFQSVLSLLPTAETFSNEMLYSAAPQITSGIPALNSAVNPIISGYLQPNSGDSVNPVQVLTFALSVIWLIGVAATIIYCIVSFLKVKRLTNEAVILRDNIYLCDRIDTPFILGVIKPKIYIPTSVKICDRSYVISHEKAHLKRLDHLWKPLGFTLLSLHWFNPLMWYCYSLFSKDIELACDEKVIAEMGEDVKKAYSSALIDCSVQSKIITPCPIAFAEVGVKERVKTVLNYKKPAFLLMVISLILGGVLAFCFLTDPKEYRAEVIEPGTYYVSENLYNAVTLDENYYNTFMLTENYELFRSYDGGDWESFGKMEKVSLTEDELIKNAPYDDVGWFKRYRVGEIKEAYITKDAKILALTQKGHLLFSFGHYDEKGEISTTTIDRLKKGEQEYSKEEDVSGVSQINDIDTEYFSVLVNKTEEYDNKDRDNVFNKHLSVVKDINVPELQKKTLIKNSEKYSLITVKAEFKNNLREDVKLITAEFDNMIYGGSFDEILKSGETKTVEFYALIKNEILSETDIFEGKLIYEMNGEQYKESLYCYNKDNNMSEQNYNNIIDQTEFDFDGDGAKENCSITVGSTSGVYSCYITIGETSNFFTEPIYIPEKFVVKDGELKIQAKNYNDENEQTNTLLFDTILSNGKIVLKYKNDELMYGASPTIPATPEVYGTTQTTLTYPELRGKRFKAAEEIYYNYSLSFYLPVEDMQGYEEIDYGLRLWEKGATEAEGYISIGVLREENISNLEKIFDKAIKLPNDNEKLENIIKNNKALLRVNDEIVEKAYFYALQNDGSVYTITASYSKDSAMLIGVWKMVTPPEETPVHTTFAVTAD